MSQINYKLELVKELYKKPNHIRGLSKAIGTNQTTIARKAIELENENVIDYVMEGKNKVYQIKNTIEAKEYVLITEHYKLLQTIKKYPIIRQIASRIIEIEEIEIAILYGSYAKNNPDKNSDIDIFIETNNPKIKRKVEEIHSKISVKTGSLTQESLLIKEIKKDNIIIKGIEKYHGRINNDKEIIEAQNDKNS